MSWRRSYKPTNGERITIEGHKSDSQKNQTDQKRHRDTLSYVYIVFHFQLTVIQNMLHKMYQNSTWYAIKAPGGEAFFCGQLLTPYHVGNKYWPLNSPILNDLIEFLIFYASLPATTCYLLF